MPRIPLPRSVARLARGAALSCVVMAAGAASAARADIIDQSNTTTSTQIFNTNSNSNRPIGQEFLPTLSALDFVDLRVDDFGSDVGPGANFLVNIRLGTITGTIVGTSNITFVPDGTNTGGGSTITRVLFPTLVSLVPNSLYVIDVVQTGTIVPGNGNFGIGGNSGNTYAAGRAIIGGTPSTTNFDFFFREGLRAVPVPEPGSIALLGIGVVASVAACRRRRK